eukprot:TRINITY_DN15164_c0_g1_i1.p1 TRINITY_DN15164_c0_g1~~TRINITY_DN15164_c0_g1_i1.p1  ORF type:complete len:584 (+),score=119.42 TRINITY_DN15164_c0_g1_i1:94-1752(+)
MAARGERRRQQKEQRRQQKQQHQPLTMQYVTTSSAPPPQEMTVNGVQLCNPRFAGVRYVPKSLRDSLLAALPSLPGGGALLGLGSMGARPSTEGEPPAEGGSEELRAEQAAILQALKSKRSLFAEGDPSNREALGMCQWIGNFPDVFNELFTPGDRAVLGKGYSPGSAEPLEFQLDDLIQDRSDKLEWCGVHGNADLDACAADEACRNAAGSRGGYTCLMHMFNEAPRIAAALQSGHSWPFPDYVPRAVADSLKHMHPTDAAECLSALLFYLHEFKGPGPSGSRSVSRHTQIHKLLSRCFGLYGDPALWSTLSTREQALWRRVAELMQPLSARLNYLLSYHVCHPGVVGGKGGPPYPPAKFAVGRSAAVEQKGAEAVSGSHSDHAADTDQVAKSNQVVAADGNTAGGPGAAAEKSDNAEAERHRNVAPERYDKGTHQKSDEVVTPAHVAEALELQTPVAESRGRQAAAQGHAKRQVGSTAAASAEPGAAAVSAPAAERAPAEAPAELDDPLPPPRRYLPLPLRAPYDVLPAHVPGHSIRMGPGGTIRVDPVQ